MSSKDGSTYSCVMDSKGKFVSRMCAWSREDESCPSIMKWSNVLMLGNTEGRRRRG